ncbi:hypothetical protein WJX74_000012 [Apatococcus lobatus]|uniref:Uncharacterized protein n=1 Tax=Apatococcus lobatus TaxID=904363 RepID=A0AAW1RD71_9CHLO
MGAASDQVCPTPLPGDIAALMLSQPKQRTLILAAALAELEDRMQLSNGRRPNPELHSTHRPKPARELGGEKELARYQWFEKTWQETSTRLSQKLQRPEDHLAMSDERAASWRQRTEMINELEANVPLTDRLGTSESLWKMSLRDNWKLEVPLGNLFTSLYVEIDQHPPPLPDMPPPDRIYRESRSRQRAALLDPASGVPVSITKQESGLHRTWADSEYLAQKQQQLSGSLAEPILVEGHNVRKRAADPWHGVCAIDVEQRLARQQPAVWAEMQRPQPDRHFAMEEASAASLPSVPPPPTQSLVMKAKVGQTGHASIRVGNPGSVALYFKCMRSRDGQVRTGGGVSSFALSSRKGCILPGTHADLTFSFAPAKVGIFWEQWELSTMPQAAQAAWPLLLRAIALEDDKRIQARLALDKRLRQQERDFQVQGALSHILQEAKPSMRQRVLTVQQATDQNRFEAANPNMADHFYSPQSYSLLQHSYAAAQNLLASVMPAPAPAAKPGAAAGGKMRASVLAPEPPKAATLDSWDSSWQALQATADQLSQAEIPGSAKDAATQQLANAIQAADVPMHATQMANVIMRQALCQALDAFCTAAEAQMSALKAPSAKPSAKAAAASKKAREAAEEEAKKAAKVLDPKAAIRAAAQEAICNAVSEFETRVDQQLGKALKVLEAPRDQQGAGQLPQKDSGSSEEACWHRFAACRAAANLKTWQHQAYSSPAMKGQ